MNEECCLACHVGCAKWSAKTRKKLLYFFPGNDTDDDHMEFYCKRHAKVNKDDSLSKKTKTKRKDSSNEDEEEFSDSEDLAIVENENDIFDADSDNETKIVKNHSTTIKRKMEKQSSSTDSLVQKKTKKKSASSQIERKVVKQSSQDSRDQRKEESNSKYFQKKRRLKDSLEEMTKDLNSAIVSAVEKGRDVELAKKRVYLYWKQHGNLTKKEFADLWQKISESAAVVGGAKNLENHRNRNVASKLKRQLSDEGFNGSRGVKRKKETQNRWIKLFVPFYEEGAIFIDDDKFCKQMDITESDFENDDDEVMLSS